MIAAIPYTTFPGIDLGPVTLRTFGLMVALGVVAGTMVAARWGERFGVVSDRMVSVSTRMVVAGVIGARITWVLTHLSEIDSFIDVIAVWEGGLQFSGGFLSALAVGLPMIRPWGKRLRWQMLDGMVLALTIGMALGRVGCYSVGEHLGAETSFFLGSRYEGGSTREGPIALGTVIHNTALYEFMHLVLLAALLWWLLYRRQASLGTSVGTFLVWYGVARFLTDLVRAYDDTIFGLTGAQWMSVVMVPMGLWVLIHARPKLELAESQAQDELTHPAGA